jgi:peptide/nickel transport system ATP-binding protein
MSQVEKIQDNILEVRHLKKYFPVGKTFFGKPLAFLKAVDDVSFVIPRGSTLGIVGESGCGKTTLGRTILNLQPATGGEVIFEGNEITTASKAELRKLRTQMQIVFQDPYSSLPPRSTVGEIIGEAVKVHNIVPKEEVRDYVISIMKKCGLQEFHYDRFPHEFSGGQRQRICIARALAVKPTFVVCDEPVSALDVSIQAQIVNLFKELQQQDNLTYMFISHDLSVVEHISSHVGVMYLGNMMEMAEKTELFANPKHPYTQALLSAVPVPDPHYKSNRIILQGDIPSPINPPKGCKFHTRCNKCMEECKYVTPSLNDTGDGHFVACHLYLTEEEKAQVAEQTQQIKEDLAKAAAEAEAKAKNKKK